MDDTDLTIITFKFEGITYTAPMSAYDATFIVLPDGTAISPNGWLLGNAVVATVADLPTGSPAQSA